MLLKLILLPNSNSNSLRSVYKQALTQSVDLIIVSAYLTEWDHSIALGEKLKNFHFIVGKDFGITRKAACRAVLNWLPKGRMAQFRVAEQISGFHPKAIFWREDSGKYFALVGSSNLTKAAFESNHEINGFSEIDAVSFDAVRQWTAAVNERSVTVSESWLNSYVEAVPQPKRPADVPTNAEEIDLSLPVPDASHNIKVRLKSRRAQMKVFRANMAEMEKLFRDTAAARWSKILGNSFYERLNELWAFREDGSRFQGPGWERTGRNSNFKQLAASLVAVLDAPAFERDSVVGAQIDSLKNLGNPTRSALFSEMLCQFFPAEYPVLDAPVKAWLKTTNFAPQRGATEGAKYVDLAVKLRAALKQDKKNAAKNLAELDVIIWYASSGAA